MTLTKSILSLLSLRVAWERSVPLIRPERLNWDPSLVPQTVQVNGSTVYYVVKGDGKPVILLHGYGAGIWVWEKQIDFLSRFCRVYAPDLIGHGFSDRPKIDYTPQTYIRFFSDFMTGIGVDRATVIGNSMGGGLAWSFAALYPRRVDKLILIDCIPPDVSNQVRNRSFRAMVIAERLPFLLYLAIAGRNKDSIRSILQECVADIRLITPEVVDRQYAISRIAGTTWTLYSTFRNAKHALKLKDDLSRIDSPTLLIWGEKDIIFPATVGEGLQRAIRGSTLQIIQKSGHIPMWETPEEVNRSIASFLSC